jgi:hypothetical protein
MPEIVCTGLHMTLQCEDTKLWTKFSQCIPMPLPKRKEPIKRNERGNMEEEYPERYVAG